MDSACGRPEIWTGIMDASLISASEIAFTSLPAMHLNGDVDVAGLNSTSPPAGVVGGEISKSCPLPASSFPVDEVNVGVAAPPRNSKKYFDPHWSDQAVEEAIEVINIRGFVRTE